MPPYSLDAASFNSHVLPVLTVMQLPITVMQCTITLCDKLP